MKKSDLENGMIVETRNGDRYIVMDDILLGEYGYCKLLRYNDDLIMNSLWDDHHRQFDIMKVFKKTFDLDIYSRNRPAQRLIWERPEVKEVTMEEIEKKFGCPVKIITEKHCNNCRYLNVRFDDEPCQSCNEINCSDLTNWEPKSNS